MKIYSIVLAAGQGVRMKSKTPKVLHEVAGLPMISHVLARLTELEVDRKIVVVGVGQELVRAKLGDACEYIEQKEQLGTAHAIMQAKSLLAGAEGLTLVICGDTPLITTESLAALIEKHKSEGAAATILTAIVDKPTGYGRIIHGETGLVVGIVEESEATETERAVKEINSGVYCFDNRLLFDGLSEIKNDNRKGEYYLTDMIEILRKRGAKVCTYCTSNLHEIHGVNDRVALVRANRIMRWQINHEHLLNGVTILDPLSTYIEANVQIGQDTTIYPNCYITAGTVIGEDCSIGPFAYIRPGTVIGDHVKIGDFVELKNSTVGSGTKIPHHAYIGDSDVGKCVNVGSGTITVNYNGFVKRRVKIGDRAFIGCNSNLIAPVEIGEDAYIAAGSTITEDVDEGAFAIARMKQENKKGYAKKLKEKHGGKCDGE